MDQEKIGKFIAESRKNKKLTQLELAEKLGVTDRSVSKWENAKCLPDVSLYKPLCKILGISINELLYGEKISKENYQEILEENILNTIAYTNKKINDTHNRIGIFVLILGISITITALTIFPSESSWSSIYSVFGLIIALIGFSRFTRKLSYPKRIDLNFGFYIIFMIFLFVIDFINVKLNDQAPMFRTYATTVNSTIYYDTPFYDVFRCNKDSEDEYWVIEPNKKHDIESIMKYCK